MGGEPMNAGCDTRDGLEVQAIAGLPLTMFYPARHHVRDSYNSLTWVDT